MLRRPNPNLIIEPMKQLWNAPAPERPDPRHLAAGNPAKLDVP